MSQSPSVEAARRRTFAIISHPDAGKTTLTENLLLAGEPSAPQVRCGPGREPPHPFRLDEDRARAGDFRFGQRHDL